MWVKGMGQWWQRGVALWLYRIVAVLTSVLDGASWQNRMVPVLCWWDALL